MRHLAKAIMIGQPVASPGEDSFHLVFHRTNSSDGAINIAMFYGQPMVRSPIQALYEAVLVQAINEGDRRWFEGDNFVLPFTDVCVALNLDPGAARAAILPVLPPARVFKRSGQVDHETMIGVPGREYTHEYGSCENVRVCNECTSRYHYNRRLQKKEKARRGMQ